MEKARKFSSDTPAELIRAIEAIAPLVTNPVKKPDHIPMSGGNYGGTLHDALCVVHGACPRVGWVTDAFVSWIGIGLADWTRKVYELIAGHNGGVFDASELLISGWHEEENTLGLGTLEFFMTTGYVRGHRNRLLNAYFEMLSAATDHLRDGEHLSVFLAKAIVKRHGCWHRDDPQRDETACLLMMERYFGDRARAMFDAVKKGH